MNFVDFLFEGKQDPSSILLITGDERYSFAEIQRETSRISSHLWTHYGSDNEILLLADNSPFFIISYLAIIKSGNTAIVLDTKSSPDDIKKIILRCSPVVGLVEERYRPRCAELLSCISETESKSIPLRQAIIPDCNPESPAVIIFTSGSTGEKKGVMLSHRNLIANTKSIIQYLNLTSFDRICVVLPFYYCYGASLLHTHIRAGGSIVLGQSIFLGSVLKTITSTRCTGFAGVPSTYQILISKTPFLDSELPTLRYFTQAGGHLADHFIQSIIRSFPDKEFFVMYGATEATARLSYLPPDLLNRKCGSVGKGISGVELQVHDENGEMILPGETGEIVARGDNIMIGYYQDPEGTAEVLHDGWYHTGDLGTVDTDGYIYVTGRKGLFIKSAGFRVSPQEIEDIISAFPGVRSCIVGGTPHRILGEALVACVVSERNDWDYKQEIIMNCRERLPTHKVPVDILFIPNIPLNSSGKPDRIAINTYIKDTLTENPKDLPFEAPDQTDKTDLFMQKSGDHHA